MVDENEEDMKLTIKNVSELFNKLSTILNYSSYVKELLSFRSAKK